MSTGHREQSRREDADVRSLSPMTVGQLCKALEHANPDALACICLDGLSFPIGAITSDAVGGYERITFLSLEQVIQG